MFTSIKKAGALALFLFSGVSSAGIIEKAPDLGNYWNPLSSTGTYVYANSFVAEETGTVALLGLWLNGGSSNLVFMVLDSVGGNSAQGPSIGNVLATTATVAGQFYGALTYVEASAISSVVLNAGSTYWFAASTIGLGGQGGYNVGGHTQNSGGISDSGTFWYSNDPTGASFDGRNLTPEMAFRVTANAVPEPASIALLSIGLIGLGALRRRNNV